MRQNESHAIIGAKGTGKSTFTRDLINASYNASNQRILIVSQTDPGAYADLPRIDTLSKLATWKGNGIVKFYSNEGAAKMMAGLVTLAQKGVLKNGLIVFEDCTNYITANPHESIKNFLVNHRMYNLDLIYTTHSLKFIPKFFWKLLASVTVFKTLDTFTSYKEVEAREVPNAMAVFSAWQKVKLNHSQFFHLTIKTGL